MKLEYILAGRIVAPHGIRGEVRVLPRDEDPAFLTRFRTFYIDQKPVQPSACHVHKNVTLMKFNGCDDRNGAEALCGKQLYIRREDAKLPEGELFDDELLGMEVYDEETGALLGKITSVEHYPASKVYTVKGEKEYLVPAVPGAFIRSVDPDSNRIDIHVWEGLATDEH